METYLRLPVLSLVVLVASGMVTTGCADRGRGVPASEGIGNFGRVNASLLRGAQPDATGIEHLQELGVKTVINLRMPDDVWEEEATDARAHGIDYFNVPLAGLGAPTNAQVERVLALIASSPGPVFVHCEHGADRTGTIVACYRMRHDGWSATEALAEAKKYGLSIFQPGMRDFIRQHAPVRK